MTTTTRHVLGRVRARARTGIFVEAAGAGAIALGVFAASSFGLDRWLRLEFGFRAALLAVLVVALARVLQRRLLRPLRATLSDDELALAVERQDPPLREALISAVQFARVLGGGDQQAGRGTESRTMMAQVVHDVEARTRAIDFVAALDGRRVLRYAGAAVALVAGLAAWTVLSPDTVKMWLRRSVLLSAVEWPRATHLEFLDPVLRVPQGDDVTLRVGAQGVLPEQVTLRYTFDGGERGSEVMTLTGESEFRFTLQSLLEGVRVRASGGDGLTSELRVEIVERPLITGVRAAVDPPAYVQAPPAELAAPDGDLRVLRGSRVRLAARSSKPVRQAFLMLGTDERVELSVDADQLSVHGEFAPTQSGAVAIDVVDADRLGAKDPPRIYLRVGDDQVPTVDYRVRGIGSMVTAVASIPGTVAARDDLALTAVAAEHRVTGQPNGAEPPPPPPEGTEPPPPPAEPEFQPLKVAGLEAFVVGEREVRADVVIDLRALAIAQPGQMVTVRWRVQDNFGPDAAQVGHSEVALFRVVTAEELAADLQRRQLEQRKLLEAVLKQETDARARLVETLSPSASDPRADDARRVLVQLAKLERDLGARVAGIAAAYTQILEESENNRIADAGAVRTLRAGVVEPLSGLATDRFPQAAVATETFAAAGHEDLRQVAVAVYDSIIGAIQAILTRMGEEERLARVIAMLRDIIKLEDEAAEEARKRREAAGAEIFGPGRDDKPKK